MTGYLFGGQFVPNSPPDRLPDERGTDESGPVHPSKSGAASASRVGEFQHQQLLATAEEVAFPPNQVSPVRPGSEGGLTPKEFPFFTGMHVNFHPSLLNYDSTIPWSTGGRDDGLLTAEDSKCWKICVYSSLAISASLQKKGKFGGFCALRFQLLPGSEDSNMLNSLCCSVMESRVSFEG